MLSNVFKFTLLNVNVTQSMLNQQQADIARKPVATVSMMSSRSRLCIITNCFSMANLICSSVHLCVSESSFIDQFSSCCSLSEYRGH